ncbi:MAG: hypothetical protein QXV37_03275 [Candidatus Jordarchaeaceae archaeon]
MVAELLEIRELDGEEKIDKYGFKWRRYKRKLKVIGRREFNEITRDLPKDVEGKIFEQKVWLCIDPEYAWHFKTTLGEKRLLITLSEGESKRILTKQG